MKIYFKILSLICFGIIGCNADKLTSTEYMSWVNDPDNGLRVSKEFEDYRFELLYKPSEYVVLNEQRSNTVNKDAYTKRLNEINEMQYYTLKIESNSGVELLKNKINSEQEYGMRLQYFSDLAQYDIKLVDGNDTLSCALFHFERNYGIAPYNNIVLGFPKGNNSNTAKVLSFDEKMLGVGKVNLKIAGEDINNIPELILN